MWSNDYEKSFQELKNRLVTPQAIIVPLGSRDYVNYNDASHQGLGCVLMQNGKVIAYCGPRISAHEFPTRWRA